MDRQDRLRTRPHRPRLPAAEGAATAGKLAVSVALVAVVVVLVGGGCGGSDPVVARVAGAGVSSGEVRHLASLVASVGGGLARGRGAARKAALDLLIRSRWVDGQAHEERLAVSKKQAVQRLEQLRFSAKIGAQDESPTHDALLSRLISSSRVPQGERLSLMRLALLEAKVEHARYERALQAVSQQDIIAYYAHHKRRFVRRERREMEILGNYSKPRVIRAKHEIEHGTPFLQLARKISVDTEAPGGLWNLVRGTDEVPVERVVFNAKPHVVTGPAKYLFFYYLFRVFKIVPAHQQTLAEAEHAIRRQLAPNILKTELVPSYEAGWKARTSCRPGYVIARCRQHAG